MDRGIDGLIEKANAPPPSFKIGQRFSTTFSGLGSLPFQFFTQTNQTGISCLIGKPHCRHFLLICYFTANITHYLKSKSPIHVSMLLKENVGTQTQLNFSGRCRKVRLHVPLFAQNVCQCKPCKTLRTGGLLVTFWVIRQCQFSFWLSHGVFQLSRHDLPAAILGNLSLVSRLLIVIFLIPFLFSYKGILPSNSQRKYKTGMCFPCERLATH